MLDQPIAKLLLCGVCLTLFPTHADYPNTGLKHYNDQSSSQAPLRHAKNTPAISQRFVNDKSKMPVKRSWQVRLGLRSAISYLHRQNLETSVAQSGVNVTVRELINTASSLQRWHGNFTPDAMQDHFYLQRLYHGSVNRSKFTGYYTPIISAQLYANKEFRYPIYSTPKNSQRYLSRSSITAGALANKGLEIAWTNDPVGLFYIHIQGSGILKLPDGQKKTLRFDGSNEKRFKSIAHYMKNKQLIVSNPSRNEIQKWLVNHPDKMEDIFNINPRFIYFTLDNNKTKTASGTPVITGHTIAVDTNYIPFGAVILAEVPVINRQGHTIDTEWRLLFSQDRGDAIEGPARMDVYTGIGETARRKANHLTGYRKAYLLINKSIFNNGTTT
jgi:membrane-bound lytic murein transglycosylase A